jgi:DNA-binding NtrC family response regulator
VNCGAIPPGLVDSELFGHERGSFTGALAERRGWFERADRGTLFLDEIGELPLEAQVRLLRVLQDHTLERVGGHRPIPVDVRIVAATHRDLPQRIKEGLFREDLYYRLNVIELSIPPLRERGADIAVLAHHFLRQYAEANGKDVRRISDDAMGFLLRHSWPGNVRELENAMERAVVMAEQPVLNADHFPTLRTAANAVGALPQRAGISIPGSSMAQLEKEAILRTLEAVAGSTSRAAEILQISPRKIQYKLKEYHEEGALRRPVQSA